MPQTTKMHHQTNISNSNKSYLMSKGFMHVGYWKKTREELDYSLEKKWMKLSGIYVFIDSNDQVLYIGRTVMNLETALNRIQRGHETQVTNHRVHNHLLAYLEKPLSVEIFAHANQKEHTDLAAFFDDFKTELLQHTSPIWNL